MYYSIISGLSSGGNGKWIKGTTHIVILLITICNLKYIISLKNIMLIYYIKYLYYNKQKGKQYGTIQIRWKIF